MTVRIRCFDLADTESILELWGDAGIERPWLDLRAEIIAKVQQDADLFMVAEEQGEVVGCVMGAYDGWRGWIYHLAVDPARQRNGIGSRLMRAVEKAMRDRGIEKVNLQVRHDNQHVAAFYESIGYADEDLRSFGK